MDAERFTELEIKVAFQDKVIADLEALVRSFGVRLDELARDLKQMKDAVRHAEAAGGLGTYLHQMFQRTFAVAKEVRSTTEIGAHSVSMAAAAVRLSVA